MAWERPSSWCSPADAWLALPQLLFGHSGPVTGASYSDIHARIPAIWVEIAAALIGAVLVAVERDAKAASCCWPLASAFTSASNF